VRLDRNLLLPSNRIQTFKDEVGRYRAHRLAVCKAIPKEIETNEKEVCNIFKSNGLKITIDANN